MLLPFRRCKRELLGTRERLRNIAEELEAANEELQSSNEEYLSVNEELQSTNEELETSKEELQSLNEELQTINAELNHRNENLVRSNSDLANLFDSTSIATLFLDRDLRIRRFTPRLLEIFNLREGDEGRPISDIVTHLTRDGLGHDVQQVLRSLVPIEREVMMAEDGASYLMQVRPYRDLNNVIDGAVVTFVDISERKKHEQARGLLAAIVEGSQDAIVSQDLAGLITSWNSGAEQLYGYSAAEAIGQPMTMLLAEGTAQCLAGCAGQAGAWRADRAVRQRQGWQERSVGRGVGHDLAGAGERRSDRWRFAGRARHLASARRPSRRRRLLLGELDHRVKNILAVVSAVVSQTLKTTSTPEMFAAEVDGRIKAIARAHSLLTQAGQGEMSLRAIFVDRVGALRSQRRQYRHHWPRRRADPQGRAGLGDGGPRAGQQCGQVWRALDTRRSPDGRVAGSGQRQRACVDPHLDGSRGPAGAAAGATRVWDDADRAHADPRTRCRGAPGVSGDGPALHLCYPADTGGRPPTDSRQGSWGPA